jgi:hypothetical protein
VVSLVVVLTESLADVLQYGDHYFLRTIIPVEL